MDAKDIRKQVRNVIQENLDTIVSQEVTSKLRTELTTDVKKIKEITEAELKARLDNLEKNVNATLKQNADRSRAVQGFLVQTVQRELQQHMHNMEVTMLAWQAVAAEKLGDVSEFNKLVDMKKLEISAKIQEDKEKAMAAAIEEKAKQEATAAPEQPTESVQKPA